MQFPAIVVAESRVRNGDENGFRSRIGNIGIVGAYPIAGYLQVARCVGVIHVKKAIVLVVGMKCHTQQAPLATAGDIGYGEQGGQELKA